MWDFGRGTLSFSRGPVNRSSMKFLICAAMQGRLHMQSEFMTIKETANSLSETRQFRQHMCLAHRILHGHSSRC